MVHPHLPGSPAHRAHELSTLLRSTRERDYTVSPETLTAYAVALSEIGMHVTVHTGEKAPADLRTADERAADGGRGGWYTGTTDPARLSAYIQRAWSATGRAPGLGIHLGPSGLVVVDADTEGDAIAWHRLHWENEVAAGVPARDVRGPLTVRTPGVCRDGVWVHKDGAHCYYVLPHGSVVRPVSESAVVPIHADEHRAGWDIKAGPTGVMVPPSSRAEGPYTAYMSVGVAPRWLIAMAEPKAVEPRAPRDTERDTAVDEAMDDVPWADILDGVALLDGEDKDGCEVYTRPGGQPRSIVCHAGCESAHGSHVATIHSDTIIAMYPLLTELAARRGSKNFTRWECAAAFQFHGDLGAAAKHYGFSRPRGDWNSVIVIPSVNGAPAVGASAMPLATAHLNAVLGRSA